MSTFKNYLQSRGLSVKSVDSNEQQLYYYLNWSEDHQVEVENSTHNDIMIYIRYLQQKGIKQITIQKYIGSLKHYFNWQIERQNITHNPCEHIKIRGVQRKQLYPILKKIELEKLYDLYPGNLSGNDSSRSKNGRFQNSERILKRNKVILGLMIWQGLGTSELSRLQLKDVKLREGKIYITGSRKSNEREMKLEATQILDLIEYTSQTRKELLEERKKIREESHANEQLEGIEETEQFILSTGQGLSIHNLMARFIKQLKEINPKINSLQQIRTSVITYWLRNYNLREVQYMAGHRYVSSTEGYLVNDLDDLTDEINKYHPI